MHSAGQWTRHDSVPAAYTIALCGAAASFIRAGSFPRMGKLVAAERHSERQYRPTSFISRCAAKQPPSPPSPNPRRPGPAPLRGPVRARSPGSSAAGAAIRSRGRRGSGQGRRARWAHQSPGRPPRRTRLSSTMSQPRARRGDAWLRWPRSGSRSNPRARGA